MYCIYYVCMLQNQTKKKKDLTYQEALFAIRSNNRSTDNW